VLAQSPATGARVTLTDDTDSLVSLPVAPERLVSLSPAITEIVFALGAGDRLVGGTDFDDFPAEAPALPDVATYQGVLMEQVVALEPDLVLASGCRAHPGRRHRPDARAGLPGRRDLLHERG